MLIIGPPGSGKGTQAERISERLGVVAISTGEYFPANVKGETPLGIEARKRATPKHYNGVSSPWPRQAPSML
jgi:adenylate kinase family enzyme